jgi:hypothetical protein
MNLADALNSNTEGMPPNGTSGHESDWLSFCSLEVPTGSLWAGDPNIVNRDDGCVVKVPAGTYVLEAKVMDFAGHKKISRVRAILSGTLEPRLGKEIGEAGTDSALIGLCDIGALETAVSRDHEKFQQAIKDHPGAYFGIIRINIHGQVEIPFVSSGLGDGTGPVAELKANRRRIGIELEFIAADHVVEFGEPDHTYDRMQNLVNARACLYCKGTGQCYCLRSGAVSPEGCVRCNGSGSCRSSQGSGKLGW